MPPIVLDGARLTPEGVEAVADGASCTLSAAAVRRARGAVHHGIVAGAAP